MIFDAFNNDQSAFDAAYDCDEDRCAYCCRVVCRSEQQCHNSANNDPFDPVDPDLDSDPLDDE